MPDYVVDIKPSARRRNAAVGSVVNRRGRRRRFEAREDAEAWAMGLSADGACRVWIRAANPDDSTAVDGYLVARRPRYDLAGAFDKRRRRLRDADGSEQASLLGGG